MQNSITGQWQMQKKDYVGAVTNLTQAIEHKGMWDDDFKISGIYLNLAYSKYQMGDYAGAVAAYDEYIRQNPRFDHALFKSQAVSIYFARGVAQYAATNYPAAIADFGRVLALRPKDGDAYYYRAAAKWQLKDFAGAGADFDAALTNHHVMAEAYSQRAGLRQSLKDFVDASADYSQAIRLDPKNVDAYLNRGVILLGSWRLSGGIDQFQQRHPAPSGISLAVY